MTPDPTTPSPRRMSDEEIAAIKARAKAATDGPWDAIHLHSSLTPNDDEKSGIGLDVGGPPEPSLRGQFSLSADAQFIAHSREDIPNLLSHIAAIDAERAAVAGEAMEVAKQVADRWVTKTGGYIKPGIEHLEREIFASIAPILIERGRREAVTEQQQRTIRIALLDSILWRESLIESLTRSGKGRPTGGTDLQILEASERQIQECKELLK